LIWSAFPYLYLDRGICNKQESYNREAGIIPRNEYFAVVYQDEKPLNVIGTFENEAGQFSFSIFGYELDLAKNMDKLNFGEKILYEFPEDAWYLFDAKNKTLFRNRKSVDERGKRGFGFFTRDTKVGFSSRVYCQN
jgi:hypothetical protein